MDEKKIILFDGECNFCDKSVQFIIKRDPKAYFQFASIQSNVGQGLMKEYNIPQNLDSLLLLDNNEWYDQSTAALRIAKHLSAGWKLAYCLLFIPKRFRDYFYRFIANHRYRIFGKKNTCTIPSPQMRKRFLND